MIQEQNFDFGEYCNKTWAVHSFLPKKPVLVISNKMGDVGLIGNYLPDEEQAEFARLFAASPNLLTACKIALRQLNPDSMAYQHIRLAIRQAEGSTNE